VSRLLRPLVAAAVIGRAVLTLHLGHTPVSGSTPSALQRGAASARHDLVWAPQRALEPAPAQP
jgi:hypothetical protein